MSYVFSILGGTEQKVSGIYPNISWYFLGFVRKWGAYPQKKNNFTRKDNDELVTRWMEWGRPAWLDMVKKQVSRSLLY